ncbi:MAG TPA: cation:proton antiporter, partial [Planctomycetaceae bacterium]|nr:cation:proton antiporter [Planctomycetaceae bacterium]
LGPTCFGWIAPGVQSWLFPRHGPAAVALQAIVALAVALLLLIAGMEVDLSTVWRQGRASLLLALGGVLIPLLAGGVLAWYAPDWWGMPVAGHPQLFAIFFGTALAVSALPVIAKIFLDLDLFHTDFGMLVLVAATVNNLLAWLVFSVVLGGTAGEAGIAYILVMTIGFVLFTLTLGRQLADVALLWAQAHLSWPNGVLGFLLTACLVGSAVTEAIGIHAIFGAFLVGIALGDSTHLREHTRHIVHRFVESFLAPVFVAAIGLQVNFAANFHPWLVLRVVGLGVAVKVLGCWLAARAGGIRGREAWAVGWAMNTRGELGIVLGLLAWQAGVIRERLFVALVTLAILTSALAGPMLRRLLQREKSLGLADLLDSSLCIPNLPAADARDAIRQLSVTAAPRLNLEHEYVAHSVLERESMMGTGIGHGIAIPHARLRDLRAPVIAVARLSEGVLFDGLDREPVQIVFLVLTPLGDTTMQLQIMSSISHAMRDPTTRAELLRAETATGMIAAIRIGTVLRQTP